MAMGTILRVVRDELRRLNNWPNEACRVAFRGEPLDNTPTEFFVGIDEVGTTSGPQHTYDLEETYRLEIWAWRKLPQYPHDRREAVLVDEDIYLGHVELPHDLERKILQAVHFQYPLMNKINEAMGVPTPENGSGLIAPLVYEGRSRTQTKVVSDGGQTAEAWAGRGLRFGGATRIQSIGCMG